MNHVIARYHCILIPIRHDFMFNMARYNNSTLTDTHLAVMDVVSSGPAMFAGLFTMLPLEEIVNHGIILGTSSSSHTLQDKQRHIHIILKLLVRVTSSVHEQQGFYMFTCLSHTHTHITKINQHCV